MKIIKISRSNWDEMGKAVIVSKKYDLDSFLNEGKAKEKNLTKEDVDPEELKLGIEFEMEHTSNREIAEKIALDHLYEIKDYYSRLKKMESEGKKR